VTGVERDKVYILVYLSFSSLLSTHNFQHYYFTTYPNQFKSITMSDAVSLPSPSQKLPHFHVDFGWQSHMNTFPLSPPLRLPSSAISPDSHCSIDMRKLPPVTQREADEAVLDYTLQLFPLHHLLVNYIV
jgi:hypothetical protein